MSVLHALRDTAITLFSVTGATALYRARQRKHGPLVRIVVFHDVHDAVWFDGLMRTLVEHYHVITPHDFEEKRFRSDAINILVTFDDGYASWIHHALPVLGKYGVKGLFFVNSGLLDVADNPTAVQAFMENELMIRPRMSLTWNGARQLVREGHVMGSHAYHHHNLVKLSGEAAQALFLKDRARIEEMLGISVTHAAYPFGTPQHVNETVIDAAKKIGFAWGHTAITGFVPPDATFRIPRTCIESEATPSSLKKWVEGGYDLFDRAKKLCVQ